MVSAVVQAPPHQAWRSLPAPPGEPGESARVSSPPLVGLLLAHQPQVTGAWPPASALLTTLFARAPASGTSLAPDQHLPSQPACRQHPRRSKTPNSPTVLPSRRSPTAFARRRASTGGPSRSTHGEDRGGIDMTPTEATW